MEEYILKSVTKQVALAPDAFFFYIQEDPDGLRLYRQHRTDVFMPHYQKFVDINSTERKVINLVDDIVLLKFVEGGNIRMYYNGDRILDEIKMWQGWAIPRCESDEQPKPLWE